MAQKRLCLSSLFSQYDPRAWSKIQYKSVFSSIKIVSYWFVLVSRVMCTLSSKIGSVFLWLRETFSFSFLGWNRYGTLHGNLNFYDPSQICLWFLLIIELSIRNYWKLLSGREKHQWKCTCKKTSVSFNSWNTKNISDVVGSFFRTGKTTNLSSDIIVISS